MNSPTTQTVVRLRFDPVSDRDPSAEPTSDEDEGLISRFWKAPPGPPAPVAPTPPKDGDAADGE